MSGSLCANPLPITQSSSTDCRLWPLQVVRRRHQEYTVSEKWSRSLIHCKLRFFRNFRPKRLRKALALSACSWTILFANCVSDRAWHLLKPARKCTIMSSIRNAVLSLITYKINFNMKLAIHIRLVPIIYWFVRCLYCNVYSTVW